MKKIAAKDLAVGACIALAAITLVAMIVIFIKKFPSNSGEWASWVQAWAAIGAIIAATCAIVIPMRHAIVKERRETFKSHLALIRVALSASNEAQKTLQYIADQLTNRVWEKLVLRTERIEDLQQTFQSLMSKDLPPYLLPGMMTIQRDLAYTVIALRQLERANGVTMKRVENARRRADVVKSIFEDWRNEYANRQLIALGFVQDSERYGTPDFSEMSE